MMDHQTRSKKRRNGSFKGFNGSNETFVSGLKSSLSSMFLRDFDRTDLPETEDGRSARRSARTMILPIDAEKESNDLQGFGIPEDVAVHFGNFYCAGKKSRNNGAWGREEGTNKRELPVRDSPRSEFTGQMVHKLEKLAGTVHYAQQISALLDETVESPNYVVKQPPDESLPYEKFGSPSYPLWYKDPDKIKSPMNESLDSIETRGKNVPSSKTQRCEGATSHGSILINATSNIDSEVSLEVLDRENNYESSSIASKVTINSMETTEDDTESEELQIDTLVK